MTTIRIYAAGVTALLALVACGSDGDEGRELALAQWDRETPERQALLCDTVEKFTLEAAAMAWEDEWADSTSNEHKDAVMDVLEEKCTG